MIEFCECGSVKFKGNCSYSKCIYHTLGIEMATYKQIEYIEGMLDKLRDDTKYAYRDMTVKDASEVIKELEGRLEVGT